MSDLSNDLELQIAEIKGENAASATQIATEQKAKDEIMEAKVKKSCPSIILDWERLRKGCVTK